MTERLLQYIWQFQHFNRDDLTTTQGEVVSIVNPGQLNHHQGPDFTAAKVKIGQTLWAGNIELHLQTSQWKKHGHHGDAHYNNVMLHVVYEHDADDLQVNIPVIELRQRISRILLDRYRDCMNHHVFIPCEKMLPQVKNITLHAWMERMLVERLTRKTNTIFQYLEQSRNSWEDVFWWLLARNFGTKVNADLFEQVARSIPINLLARQKNNLLRIEALLQGQAHLLDDDFTDDYPLMLQKEYRYLKQAHHLSTVPGLPKFLRMRPANFPCIRLSQLAMLVHQSSHLFSKIKEAETVAEMKEWFDVSANDYWHYHYRFQEPGDYHPKKTGSVMINHIMINTVVPVLFAYGHHHGLHAYKDKALLWMQNLQAEKNNITRGFEVIGVKNKSASDSQALIELKNQYCDHKRCLDCAIGNVLIRG